MNESIKDKIAKLLALGERAGTEAEAEAAMHRAHVLLAKHNLSLDEVKGHHEREEAIEIDDSTPSVLRNTQWRDMIYEGIAELYFCDIFLRYRFNARGERVRKIAITGRPSNIEVVKYIAGYLIRTGDELASAGARAAAQHLANDGVVLNVRAWAGSFRVGYGGRILSRAQQEIQDAKAGGIKDETTGTALVVAPLYDREKQAVAAHISAKIGKLKTTTGRGTVVRSSSGYQAGSAAGERANLRANALGGDAPQRQIAG